MPPAFDIEHKVTILTLINEKKATLFGSFSPTLTFQNKEEAWNDIAKRAQDLKIYKKDGKYLRDTTWQNWRKRSIEKRDNRDKTGKGGGKAKVFDQSDNLVFEIIGNDSAVLDGLDIPETHSQLQEAPSDNAGNQHGVTGDTTEESSNGIENEEPTSSTPTSDKPTKRSSLFKANLMEKRKVAEEEGTIRSKKQRLLDLEAYKRRLEIFKLEKELLLPPSEETKEFHTQSQDHVTYFNFNE